MANVLVLGGSGFVGTELIAQLKKRKDKICAIYHKNKCDDDVENIKADLTDETSMQKALEGKSFDIIYEREKYIREYNMKLEKDQVNDGKNSYSWWLVFKPGKLVFAIRTV